jgi:hypothetical protein
MTFDDLKGLLTKEGGEAKDSTPSLDLAQLLPPQKVLAALAEYFGEDDSRDRVAIEIDGVHQGYLSRTSLHKMFTPAARGVGGGAHGSVPGRSKYRLIALKCSVSGCSATKLVAAFDEVNPPACPTHPSGRMQPTP